MAKIVFIFNFAGEMGRILALDYGTKRTGVAVSDPLRIIAGALATVPTAEIVPFLRQYMAENSVDVVVLGKPLQMSGAPSATWPAIEALAGGLQREFPEVKVVFYDERFTSVLARRAMIESGVPKMARRDKALADRISATIILQGYMESLGENSS